MLHIKNVHVYSYRILLKNKYLTFWETITLMLTETGIVLSKSDEV
jgi:hypothetical protein